MTQAGYNVTIQTYKFDYFAYTALPVLSEVSPTAQDHGIGKVVGGIDVIRVS
jgi:hypothetical protein